MRGSDASLGTVAATTGGENGCDDHGNGTTAARRSAVFIDNWDVRHLLLSIDDRPRPEREQQELDAVLLRVGEALASVPDVDVAPPPLAPGADGGLVIEAVPAWLLETNSWILAPHGDGGPCIIVDVPPHPTRLVERLRARRLRVEAVLLTHGHLDHAGGVAELLAALPGRPPAYVHGGDVDRLLDPQRHASALRALVPGLVGPALDRARAVSDGQLISAAGMDVDVVHTQGHTDGSVCYAARLGPTPIVFTGDVLFASGGAGRNDLPGGSAPRSAASLAMLLDRLPDETVVLPGHGGWTTIGQARGDHDRTRRATAADASASFTSASVPPLATAARTQWSR